MRARWLIGRLAMLAGTLWAAWCSPVNGDDKQPAKIELDAATRERCVAVLREGFASDEFWPAMHAAEALTLAGMGDQVVEQLAERLKQETDDQRRCGLARELVRAGRTRYAQVMLDILGKQDAYGHTHAAESLYKVNQIGDGKRLLAALRQTEDQRLQVMAAAALGRRNDQAAMALLREKVNSTDQEIARTAAWVLARIGNESDVAALREAAQRFDEPLTQAYFQHALAALGDSAGQQALVRNLGHEDGAIRTYAAVFAGDGRITSAKPQLIQLLDDPVLDVRIRAAQSLLVLE